MLEQHSDGTLVIITASTISALVHRYGDRLMDLLSKKYMNRPKSGRFVFPSSPHATPSDMNLES